MPLAEDLLEHARHLASLPDQSASQVNIRRLLSATYYSLFHLLAREAAAQVSPDQPQGLRERTQRVLEHTHMLKVAKAFSQAGASKVKDLPEDIVLPEVIPEELANMAKIFKELQEARHAADYDVLAEFDPPEVLLLVERTEQAFADWNNIRTSECARVFLATLVFGKFWNK